MKKGKYRISVTRTTEVQITVTNPEKFDQDYQSWLNMYPDDADDLTKEHFLASRAIISVAGGTGKKYNSGLTIIHLYSNLEIHHHTAKAEKESHT